MSVFNLPEDVKDLESSNSGITEFKYQQFTPNSNVIDSNGVIKSTVKIPFSCSSTEWWMPSRSYLRMRCSLTKPTTNKRLSSADKIAPNMNLMANLFKSASFTLNNRKVCSVDSNLAQIDILEQRLHKSKAWLDSVGASTNFLQEDFSSRQNDIISDSVRQDLVYDIKNAGDSV